jgi:hypothetical protein
MKAVEKIEIATPIAITDRKTLMVAFSSPY